MQIGINYAAESLKQQLADVINRANVPAILIRVTLAELLEQAKTLEAQSAASEKKEYEDALRAEAEAKAEAEKQQAEADSAPETDEK